MELSIASINVLNANHEFCVWFLSLNMLDAWINVIKDVFQADSLLVLVFLILFFSEFLVVLLLVLFSRNIIEVVIVVSAKFIIALCIEIEPIWVVEITSFCIVLVEQDVEAIIIIVTTFCLNIFLGLLLSLSGLILNTLFSKILIVALHLYKE